MDEKYIERPKKFNRVEYNKEKYKSFSTKISPELYDSIDTYCNRKGISKPVFLRLAIDTLKDM